MSKQTIFPYPGAKEVILGSTGLLLGFFSPTVLFTVINGLQGNEFLQEWIIGKVDVVSRAKNVISLESGATSFGLVIVALFVILYAIKKGANLIYILGVGFIAGLILRFVIMGVFGYSIPYASPVNETINGTLQ